MKTRMYYRKEKLRGACWEYQIDGGWLTLPAHCGDRHVPPHHMFYRPRIVEVRTEQGMQSLERTGAEQWFFPDRWFSLLHDLRQPDRRLLRQFLPAHWPVRQLLPRISILSSISGSIPTAPPPSFDRDEFDMEIEADLPMDSTKSTASKSPTSVQDAVVTEIAANGRDLDALRADFAEVPAFVLRA